MLTGEKRSQIDRIWNAFWTEGIFNPLTVIEQITYLLFIKRLDDQHTAREKKSALLHQPIARRFTRLRRKIARRDGPAQFGQMGGIPGAAAAGNQGVQRCRLTGDEAGKSRRDAASVPGRHAFIETLAPEIRVLRALLGGLGRGGRREVRLR